MNDNHILELPDEWQICKDAIDNQFVDEKSLYEPISDLEYAEIVRESDCPVCGAELHQMCKHILASMDEVSVNYYYSQVHERRYKLFSTAQEYKQKVIENTMLTLDAYQLTAMQTAIYPNHNQIGGLAYVTLGLTGEAGEVANKVKKLIRDAQLNFYSNNNIIDDEARLAIIKELGGVLWYLAQCATELGVNLSEVASVNNDELNSRALRGKLHGSGDTR